MGDAGQGETATKRPADAELDDEQPVAAPHERPWSRPWQAPFLRSLGLIPDVSSACRSAGVGRATVYRNRDSDGAFRDAWDEALEIARDNVQRVAHNWITVGVPVRSRRTRTVTKTTADGEVTTTTETIESESAERSSTLMIFWLKAWYPERYRWSERFEATGAEGGPIRVESLDTIDAQIAQLSDELAARAHHAGDPVPDEPAI